MFDLDQEWWSDSISGAAFKQISSAVCGALNDVNNNALQDPINCSPITWKHDHSLLEHEEEIVTVARRLTQTACKVGKLSAISISHV